MEVHSLQEAPHNHQEAVHSPQGEPHSHREAAHNRQAADHSFPAEDSSRASGIRRRTGDSRRAPGTFRSRPRGTLAMPAISAPAGRKSRSLLLYELRNAALAANLDHTSPI